MKMMMIIFLIEIPKNIYTQNRKRYIFASRKLAMNKIKLKEIEILYINKFN